MRHAGETPWQGLRLGLSAPRADSGLRQRAWRTAVGGLEALVRRCHGIYEYTSDPECVLRVGLARAPRDITLADGTLIGRGSSVGVLHLWNEHLPPFAPQGPDLHWAKIFHRRMRWSFALLAEHIARTPAWDRVQAVQAEISLADAAHARPLLHLCERYGFDLSDPPRSWLGRCHVLGADLMHWGLTRAFNSNALRRRHLRRARREVWISRRRILACRAP